MATFTLTGSPAFPPSSSVGIYKASKFPGSGPVAGLTPGVVADKTVALSAAGSVTIAGLAPDTNYVAGALVAGVWTYMLFRTAPVTGNNAQGGGSGPTVLSWGAVANSGAVSVAGSGDWAPSKIGTGVYRLTFASEKADANYVVIATRFVNGAMTVSNFLNASVDVTSSDLAGVAGNQGFFFVVLSDV